MRKMLILALLLLAVHQAAAAPLDATVTLTPNSLTLAPGESAETVLVLTNGTGGTLSDVALTYLTQTDLQVETVEAEMPAEIAPDGTWTRRVRVIAEPGAHVSGTVYVQVAYRWRESAESEPLAAAKVASFEVTLPDAMNTDNVAELSTDTVLTQIDENRGGRVYVKVKNKSVTPITVQNITAFGPGFVNLNGPDGAPILTDPVTLPSGDLRVFPVEVTADDQVQPGNHLLLFQVELAGVENGRAWSANLVTRHEVQVGVFGENEFVNTFKLVGIDVITFYLLPGLLMTFVFTRLYNRTVPAENALFSDLKSASFIIVSIFLSLLTLALYPILTQVFIRAPRNILQGYGFTDIFWIWMFSIGLGVLAMVGVQAVREVQEWREKRRRAAEAAQERQRLQPGDTPDVALYKLSTTYNQRKLTYPQMQHEGKNYFVVVNAGEGKSWIVPPVLVSLIDSEDEWFKTFSRQLEQALINQTEEAFFAGLREGLRKGWVTLKWGHNGGVVLVDTPAQQLPEGQFIQLE